MRFITFFASLLGVFLLPAVLMAQQVDESRHGLMIHYGINIPQKGSFVSKNSFIAPSLGYSYRSSKFFEEGISIKYIGTQQEDKRQIGFDNGVYSGRSKREFSQLSIFGEFRYFPLGNMNLLLQPYAAIAAGSQYARFYISGAALPTHVLSNWAFVLTPQIGVRTNSNHSRWFLDARLMWQYAGNAWEKAYTTAQKSIGLQVGVGMKF